MLKAGDKVRLSKAGKAALRINSRGHLKEFGKSKGIVIGLTNYNNDGENDPEKIGPEWDVRWMPERLRYAYAEEHLEIIED